MKAKTLLGQLLRFQTLVVTLACSLLVVGTMTVAAMLLRRNQDELLHSLAASSCHQIPVEMKEHRISYVEAAREAFAESAVEGYRFELWGRGSGLLVEDGQLLGWVRPSPEGGTVGICQSLSATQQAGERTTYRSCAGACGADYAVQVVTRDSLDRPEVRRAARAMLVVLPIAVLAGAVAGRIVFRRLLRPLQALQKAAARLEPGAALSLGVRAGAEELAELERAMDHLLARLGDALEREKRFVQEASHELRTPLTTLRMRLEHVKRELESRPDLGAELARALRDLEALDRLVGALLILARSESAEIPSTPVNLCDVARQVAEGQRASDGAASPAPEVDAPDEIMVHGSEELIERALANLVENSRKYAGEGARILVRVLRENGRGVVVVEDDGPGIPADLRPFAFERFFRGPSHRGRIPGAGLGLVVVRAVVVRHGGEVRAGRGSMGGEEIRISLPLLSSG